MGAATASRTAMCWTILLAAVLTMPAQADSPGSLEAAQRLFYTSKFAAAAEQALQLVTQSPTDLAAWELRTSALHFQIRRASGTGKDRKAAMAACKACPPLLEVFSAEFKRGRAAARQRLAEAPNDEQAMYYLAKIDTSYLFLQLSTLGKRTGWEEDLGSEAAARTGAGEEPESLACAGGARLDGLHRRHEGAVGHAVGHGRRQPRSRAACHARSRHRDERPLQ